MNGSFRRFRRGLSHWPAADLDERLATLSAFVDCWRASSGERSRRTQFETVFTLPASLHWLYQEIANHSDQCFRSNYSGWTEGDPIVTYHWLKRPDDLQIDESDIIEFLNETQGVYQCGVAIDSPDPCVVSREDETTSWKVQADRLSDFLFALLAFEFSLQSDFSAMGSFSEPDVARGSRGLYRVCLPVVWWAQNSVSTYHGDGVLIFATSNSHGQSTYLQAAARSAAEFEILRSFGQWEHWLPPE